MSYSFIYKRHENNINTIVFFIALSTVNFFKNAVYLIVRE